MSFTEYAVNIMQDAADDSCNKSLIQVDHIQSDHIQGDHVQGNDIQGNGMQGIIYNVNFLHS